VDGSPRRAREEKAVYVTSPVLSLRKEKNNAEALLDFFRDLTTSLRPGGGEEIAEGMTKVGYIKELKTQIS